MIMETKPIKNTGQINGHEGANWKITRRGKEGKFARGDKKLHRGIALFAP